MVHDSGRTSPAVKAQNAPSEQTPRSPTEEPAENEIKAAEATADGAEETEISDPVARTLAPGDLISIEMSDGIHHVSRSSSPSPPPGDRDPGTYRLVHFKAPEPGPKRKRPKLDPERTDQLEASSYISLDTSPLEEAMRHLPQANIQGVVELHNGDIRPAEIISPTPRDEGSQDSTVTTPRDGESVVNGNMNDEVDSTNRLASFEKQLQINDINGNIDKLESNIQADAGHPVSDSVEQQSEDVIPDSMMADVINGQPFANGATEHTGPKTSESSISKSNPVRHAEELGDTDIISITVPPGRPALQDSRKNTENDPRQQILMLSKSTVRHPPSGESTNRGYSEASGSVSENDFQVIGIQPLPKDVEVTVQKR